MVFNAILAAIKPAARLDWKNIIPGGHTGLFGKHPVKCEEIKHSKILNLNVKVKTDESKFWPMTDS